MTTETTAYLLDNQNRIVSTCGGWDQFATANESIKVSSNDILGRSIWDFIAGDMTRITVPYCRLLVVFDQGKWKSQHLFSGWQK
jgi:hypothetical protein